MITTVSANIRLSKALQSAEKFTLVQGQEVRPRPQHLISVDTGHPHRNAGKARPFKMAVRKNSIRSHHKTTTSGNYGDDQPPERPIRVNEGTPNQNRSRP